MIALLLWSCFHDWVSLTEAGWDGRVAPCFFPDCSAPPESKVSFIGTDNNVICAAPKPGCQWLGTTHLPVAQKVSLDTAGSDRISGVNPVCSGISRCVLLRSVLCNIYYRKAAFSMMMASWIMNYLKQDLNMHTPCMLGTSKSMELWVDLVSLDVCYTPGYPGNVCEGDNIRTSK